MTLRLTRCWLNGSDNLACVSGSAALSAFDGQRVVERYGMTETLMIASVRSGGERMPGYVGDPLPGTEARLVDDKGAPVEVSEDGTIGEVAGRGAGLFTGYLNQPEVTAATFRDGRLSTGDLATRDPNGDLCRVGRCSIDIIKSRGYKMGALEVEGTLLEDPATSKAAVIGVADHDLGERLTVWVVLNQRMEAGEAASTAHVRQLLPSYKPPREMHFVDEVPRTPVGKAVKSRLVEKKG